MCVCVCACVCVDIVCTTQQAMKKLDYREGLEKELSSKRYTVGPRYSKPLKCGHLANVANGAGTD